MKEDQATNAIADFEKQKGKKITTIDELLEIFFGVLRDKTSGKAIMLNAKQETNGK